MVAAATSESDIGLVGLIQALALRDIDAEVILRCQKFMDQDQEVLDQVAKRISGEDKENCDFSKVVQQLSNEVSCFRNVSELLHQTQMALVFRVPQE